MRVRSRKQNNQQSDFT